ncbi:MAG: PfkB family carbohydrate kinase [Anaerolineae bacterium]|nr:PfkB family carbohydrate kinase [Anaerolineae bacterium]
MIDFLIIGHIVQDVVPNGFTVGGTATYMGTTVRNLGRKTGIVTRLAPDFVIPDVLHDIAIHRVASARTTTFHNIYKDGRRTQFLLARADDIQPDDIPLEWRAAPIVHLGPLAREVDARFATLFPHALVGVTPQGWMREWDDTQRIRARVWEEARDILPHVDVLVLSEEDLNGNRELMDEYAALTRIAVMTQGAKGCVVFAEGRAKHVPGFPAVEVDPTGAGDVFAGAFLVRLHETSDPFEAARFANATASFCVEGPGVTTIPTRAQVEERLARPRIF